MNTIKKQLKQYQLNKQAIELMLKWTPLEYAEFQWEMMEDYILAFSGGDAEALNLYGRSIAFRKWWVNQWNIRDILNVQDVECLVWMNERREHYKSCHSAKYLLNNTVLQDGESMIVGRVIDELHEKKSNNKITNSK